MTVKKNNIVMILIAIIAFWIQVIMANLFTNQKFALDIGIFMLLIIYFLAAFSVYQIFSAVSLQFYTLFGIGIFNIGKFVQFLIEPSVLYDQEDLTHFSFDNDTIFKAIIAISLFIICIWITYIVLKNNETKKEENKIITKEYSPFFFKTGLFCMICSAPFYFYRLFLEFLAYKALGYGSIYATGGIGSSNILIRISYTVFLLGYMLICASKTSYKRFCICSILMFLSNVVAMMKGSRSEIIVSLMFFFWFSASYYRKRIKLKKLLMIAIPMVFLLQAVSQIRLGRTVELKGGFFNLIFAQSVSAYVLLAFIQFEGSMMPHSYPYILDPIVNTFRLIFNPMNIRGQSLAVINHRFDLGHQLTYYLNPIYYLNGFSLGSNAIAELWEFRWIGIVIGAVCMGVFIVFLNKKRNSSFFLFLSYIIIQYVAMCFRGNYIIGVYDVLKFGVVYAILRLLVKASKGKIK